jgi:hypothetical protein
MSDRLQLLEDRIRTLEDIEAIKDLQYSYWENVDLQQPERLRQVFHPGAIDINFQDMPLWTNRDAFVDFYRELGCTPDRIETHHGLAPRVRLTGPNGAEGTWRLRMVAFNLPSRIVVSVGGEYTAQYVRDDGRWWIKALKFVRRTLHSEHVADDGSVRVPEFGKVSADAAAHLFGRSE